MIIVIGVVMQTASTKMLKTAWKSIECFSLIVSVYSETFLADGFRSAVLMLVMLSKLPITSIM